MSIRMPDALERVLQVEECFICRSIPETERLENFDLPPWAPPRRLRNISERSFFCYVLLLFHLSSSFSSSSLIVMKPSPGRFHLADIKLTRRLITPLERSFVTNESVNLCYSLSRATLSGCWKRQVRTKQAVFVVELRTAIKCVDLEILSPPLPSIYSPLDVLFINLFVYLFVLVEIMVQDRVSSTMHVIRNNTVCAWMCVFSHLLGANWFFERRKDATKHVSGRNWLQWQRIWLEEFQSFSHIGVWAVAHLLRVWQGQRLRMPRPPEARRSGRCL